MVSEVVTKGEKNGRTGGWGDTGFVICIVLFCLLRSLRKNEIEKDGFIKVGGGLWMLISWLGWYPPFN
jgi:hypothetical protein